ncbi:hypothetical protein J5I72_26075, partial [Escherichia coli]|nr:hypothetical protein [Escherichia coli]
YGPQNDVTLKMPAFEWVHVQLHQQKGMISLSPPTICNSAKFGARWLPAKAKNSDFPGNWWIIETKHNVADVLAVIQQYA